MKVVHITRRFITRRPLAPVRIKGAGRIIPEIGYEEEGEGEGEEDGVRTTRLSSTLQLASTTVQPQNNTHATTPHTAHNLLNLLTHIR